MLLSIERSGLFPKLLVHCVLKVSPVDKASIDC